ncbi:hypothetical protein [Scytonema sp. UIC 10036]|nr:hypothetical protein [Scytonema sp. UIC 10036]
MALAYYDNREHTFSNPNNLLNWKISPPLKIRCIIGAVTGQ